MQSGYNTQILNGNLYRIKTTIIGDIVHSEIVEIHSLEEPVPVKVETKKEIKKETKKETKKEIVFDIDEAEEIEEEEDFEKVLDASYEKHKAEIEAENSNVKVLDKVDFVVKKTKKTK